MVTWEDKVKQTSVKIVVVKEENGKPEFPDTTDKKREDLGEWG